MKDNFDLKKFLTENKVFEEFNPFMAENARTDAEEEGYLDGEKDEKASLRDKVREMVLAELAAETELDEAKKDKPEEEVIDAEVTDTEEFTPDAEMDAEEATPDLEADEKAIMDNLEQALEFAKTKGDEKLIDQIGNTITFFTRQYIVK
jgi:hypothetical protein